MTCVICFDNIKNEFVTSCGHSYCQECIIEWAINKNVCPLCRKNHVLTICDCGELKNFKYSGCVKCVDLKFENNNLIKLERDMQRRYNKLSRFQRIKLKLRKMKYKRHIKKILKGIVKGSVITICFFTGTLKTKFDIPYCLFLSIFYFSITSILPPVLVSGAILIGIVSTLRLGYHLCAKSEEERRNEYHDGIVSNI